MRVSTDAWAPGASRRHTAQGRACQAGTLATQTAARHCARDPPQEHAARSDDKRELVHQLHDKSTASDNHRKADKEPKDDERHLVVAAGDFSGASDGDDVVDTHHQVGDDNRFHGTPEFSALVDLRVIVLVIRPQELNANPNKQCTADKLQVRNGQQLQCKEYEHHAQGNGSDCPQRDALGTMRVVQIATSERDYDRIVAAQ